MADTKVFSFPENGNSNNIPFSIPIGAGTEDAAWLQGYIMRLIVKAMKEDGTILIFSSGLLRP